MAQVLGEEVGSWEANSGGRAIEARSLRIDSPHNNRISNTVLCNSKNHVHSKKKMKFRSILISLIHSFTYF